MPPPLTQYAPCPNALRGKTTKLNVGRGTGKLYRCHGLPFPERRLSPQALDKKHF